MRARKAVLLYTSEELMPGEMPRKQVLKLESHGADEVGLSTGKPDIPCPMRADKPVVSAGMPAMVLRDRGCRCSGWLPM